MAARLEDIRVLAERHAREVCRNPESWTNYLDTAAKFYRYPFFDTFLIHAQKPDAVACAELPEWNRLMNRWVNRGAKGIALIDDRGPYFRLRYVFDIKDTHSVQGAKKIYLWQMNHKKEAAIRKHIQKIYGISIADKEPMPKVLMALARHLTGENIRQAMYDLNNNRGDTYLADMSEVTLLNTFTKLIEDSIAYVLMKRCGYHPLEHMDIDDFENVRLFDDINVLPYLGEAVHTITEPVLMDIGRTVAEIDRKEHEKQLEAAPIKGQMEFKLDGKNVIFEFAKEMAEELTDNENERIQANEVQETKHKEDIKEDPYGKEEQYRIHPERGLPVSEPDHKQEPQSTGHHREPGNERVAGVSKEKATERLLRITPDRKFAAGELVATTITLPLLPSPEKQKILAKPITNARKSIKIRLKEKQAEADALNSSRVPKRPQTRSKEAVI